MVSKNHVIFTDAEYRMTAAYLPKNHFPWHEWPEMKQVWKSSVKQYH